MSSVGRGQNEITTGCLGCVSAVFGPNHRLQPPPCLQLVSVKINFKEATVEIFLVQGHINHITVLSLACFLSLRTRIYQVFYQSNKELTIWAKNLLWKKLFFHIDTRIDFQLRMTSWLTSGLVRDGLLLEMIVMHKLILQQWNNTMDWLWLRQLALRWGNKMSLVKLQRGGTLRGGPPGGHRCSSAACWERQRVLEA